MAQTAESVTRPDEYNQPERYIIPSFKTTRPVVTFVQHLTSYRIYTVHGVTSCFLLGLNCPYEVCLMLHKLKKKYKRVTTEKWVLS